MGRKLGVAAASTLAGAAALAGWIAVNAHDHEPPGAPADGASQAAPPPPPAPSVTPEPADLPLTPLAAAPPTPADPAAGLRAQDAARSSTAGAGLGVAVFDRATGTTLAAADADRPFPCMSVVKLFIAVDMLDHTPGGTPDQDTADRIRRMLSHSDDAIASALWSSNGGAAIVDRTAERLGLAGTEPPQNPSEWGDTRTTPQDLVTLYRHITDQMPAPSRDLVLDSLTHTTRTAADGFDQHFGIPTGMSGMPWAVKQGWGTSGSEAAIDSTGLVGPDGRYVVVLLAKSSTGSYRSLTGAVTDAARSLGGTIGSPPP